MVRVGLISDTHGVLRPEAVAFLRGCDAIIHAGDVGVANILEELAALAPVTAIRGNIDRDAWADALPHTALVRIADVCVHVIHDLAQLDIDLQAAGVQVVVSGHSHKPVIERRHGVLFVNPGSAGPRRFSLPVTVGELAIVGADVSARIVDLESDCVLST
jgi:putative phosphoesterase